MKEKNNRTANSELDTSMLIRHITSINCNIVTKSILDLENKIKLWLLVGSCGAIIHGRPRIGKTRAIQYLADSLHTEYSEDFPIIRWDITNHAVTERNFYASFLMAIGAKNPTKGATALILKQRVLELLTVAACETKYRKIVIFIDEAHLLDQKDFYWLMDLYNVLSRRDILLTTFLFGSHELKELKTLFLSTGKEQIIGRFMMNEYEFYGLCSKEELKMCLISFDNPVRLPSSESPVRLMDVFFPEASMDGKSFANDLSDIYWDMFEDIRSRFNIHNKDIPMKYFIDSFCICLAIFGKDGYRKCYFPTAKDITDCIIESGYPNTV